MKALILVDIQNDFLPGGALAVPDGDAIVPVANRLLADYPLVVATQDWHPAGHGSFAASHEGKQVFESIELHGLPQTLWPVHCVEWTAGALLAPALDTRAIRRIFPKGTDPKVDSYSGFFDNGKRGDTGMERWLREQGVSELAICGLATDYCVKFTVLDALALGFKVDVLGNACRGVELSPGDCLRAMEEMEAAGARVVS